MKKRLLLGIVAALCAIPASAAASKWIDPMLSSQFLTTGSVRSTPVKGSIAGMSATYVGKTGQRLAVVIHVRNGTVQASSYITYADPCQGGSTLSGAVSVRGPLSAGDRFSVVNGTYTSRIDAGPGVIYTAHHTVTIDFTLGLPDGGATRSGFGSVSDSARIVNSHGGFVTHCSPPVSQGFLLVYAQGSGSLRVCAPPVGPGAYVSATPNVSCHAAEHVSTDMLSLGCVMREQCGAAGFTCRAGFPPHLYGTSFEVIHHAVCKGSRTRRIEFDWG